MARHYLTSAQVLLSLMFEVELSPTQIAQSLAKRAEAEAFISSFIQDSFEMDNVDLAKATAAAICDSILSWRSDVVDTGGGDQIEDYLSLKQSISDILVRQFGASSKEASDVQPL